VIGLYSPDVPPAPGGVADHTLALARALERHGAPPVVLARRGDPAMFAPLTCISGLAPGDVADAAREHDVAVVVIEYSPFLFARRGVSPALVRGVRRMAAAGLRLAAFVHEPWVPFTRLPWLVTGVPQRLQLRYLVRRCAHVYAAVPGFAELIRRHARPGTPVAVAPVGASIAPSTLSREEARARLGLREDMVAIGVFSPGASGFLHAWVTAAADRLAALEQVVWVRFGFGSERGLPLLPGVGTLSLGPGDAATIAQTMRALDIAAAPFVDGLTLRRTSAMLALASGVATVSSTGPLFDPAAGALASCEPTAEAFAARLEGLARDPAERRLVADRTQHYEEVASINVLARRLIADLLPERRT
jgi:hypothetical protein